MVFLYNPTLTIKDSYPIIRALESTSARPHVCCTNVSFDDNDTSAKYAIPNPWYCSGIKRHGSSMWQLMFGLGRHLKYTRCICAKSFWGDMTTVAIPHVMPGWSWRLKLFHARLCGRGHDLIQSAQLYPFFAISPTCVPPPDKGPQFTPSIRDVSLFFNVGIGSEVPSGSRTLK